MQHIMPEEIFLPQDLNIFSLTADEMEYLNSINKDAMELTNISTIYNISLNPDDKLALFKQYNSKKKEYEEKKIEFIKKLESKNEQQNIST